MTSFTLKNTAAMSSALLIKKKLIEVHGKYWKHSREVLDYEVEGCDVEKVKTEHNEFEPQMCRCQPQEKQSPADPWVYNPWSTNHFPDLKVDPPAEATKPPPGSTMTISTSAPWPMVSVGCPPPLLSQTNTLWSYPPLITRSGCSWNKTPTRTYRALCQDPEQGLGVDIEHLHPALPNTSAEQPTVPPPPPTEGHVLELGDALVQLHGLHVVHLHLAVSCAGNQAGVGRDDGSIFLDGQRVPELPPVPFQTIPLVRGGDLEDICPFKGGHFEIVWKRNSVNNPSGYRNCIAA